MTLKSPSVKSPLGLSLIFTVAAVGIISFIIYYLTAFRTVTWWDSGEYSLAAATLGVAHPPGCLLGTILGWIVVKLAVCGSAAFSLNLFAGLVASLTAIIVGIIGGFYLNRNLSLVTFSAGGNGFLAAATGAIVGGLTLAFSETFWLYATKFTPYIFTVLFTALIIWAMIKWAECKGGRDVYWLLIITLLFGLDFSVHRTNLLMAPGLIVWMLIFKARTFLSWRTWLFGIIGLAAGLAFHLLVIPMAAAKPFLNASAPDTLSGFWDYVALKQLGGGFLVQFFPRKAAFWDVQVMDYLRAFSANFFSWKGPVPIIGVLPGIFGIIGLIGSWNKNRRLAAGLIVLFLLTSLGAIFYFNIPANFFRSLFRHYMPSFVIFTVWIVFGLGSLIRAMIGLSDKSGRAVWITVLILLAVLPGYQILRNYNRLDGSGNYFAHDYALNIMNNLPQNSILITFGDNDTFPLWYYHIVEGVRPDITILNNSLLNTAWFIRETMYREPDLPLGIEASQIDSLRPIPWADTTIVIPVPGTAADFRLAEGVSLPDSMRLELGPTIADKYIMASDQLLLGLIRNNQWRRPIYLAATGNIPWLKSYLQFEGLAHRLTPVVDPPINRALLAENLLDKYLYRGFADDCVFIDPATRMMDVNYLVSFMMLAQAAYSAGDGTQLDLVKSRMAEVMPLERLEPLPENIEKMMDYLSQMKVE